MAQAGCGANANPAALATGGVIGAACDSAVANQGCNGSSVMYCDPTTGAWQVQQVCASGQYCLETAPAGTRHVAACASSSAAPANDASDTSGAAEAMACAQSKCPQQWSSCQAYTPCKNAVECLATCGNNCGSAACMGSGSDTQLIGLAVGLTTCAQNQGCVAGGSAPQCGNGKCETTETANTCAADCAPACANGKCELGEDAANCPTDCPSQCGDKLCTGTESKYNCPKDCGGPYCGDGVCQSYESKLMCSSDCSLSQAVCGNLVCEGSESAADCFVDCDPAMACVTGKCSKEFIACTADYDCRNMLDCMSTICKLEKKCMDSVCGTSASGSAVAVSWCMKSSGCGLW